MSMPTRFMLPLVAALALGSVIFGTRAMAAGPRDACTSHEDVAGAVTALPLVASIIKTGGPLRVLAVGSATMFGPEASLEPGTITNQSLNSASNGLQPVTPLPKTITQEASERAFPHQMARAIQSAVPGLQVIVVVRGGRGMSAGDMLAVLKQELATSGPYQLVLWQTGTVEAVRNSPPGEFASILSDGAEAVEAANANLVLIDPQYSRFLQTNSNLDPYTQALQQVANMPGVGLFRRFDLMRAWAADGQIDLERTPRNDRRRAVDVLHACLGQHLARLVLAGGRT